MTTDVSAPRQMDATAEETTAAARDDARPLLSLAGVVRGDEVSMRNAAAGMVAGEEVTLQRGFVRMMVAEDRIEMRQAAAQSVLAAGDVSIQQGGAGAIISNGSIRLDRGGTGVAIGRRIDVGERSLVIVGVSPVLNLAGGRVLLGPLAAIAAIGTLVVAVLVALRVAGRRGARAAKR
jgi:hypothetical protein